MLTLCKLKKKKKAENRTCISIQLSLPQSLNSNFCNIIKFQEFPGDPVIETHAFTDVGPG